MSTKNKVAPRNRRAMGVIAAPLLVMSTLAVASGCGEDNPLCCSEADFQVGGTINAEGEAGVALQAIADVAGIASASVDDLTTACRAIATDLGAPKDARDAADAEADKRAKMQAYCSLAVNAITEFKATAGGSISVQIAAPQCSASVSAKADCQGSCSGSASCDIQANPPTCEGGSLQISCSGSCTAEAGASVSCTGSCSGGCTGECTAEGGVECAGKCEGTCTTGTDDQGNCNGTCEGTCKTTAPAATCTGSCNGQCDASCEAEGGVDVKCDGSCDSEFEPLKCEGGTLKGGCEASVECEASCDASVQAKAECTPPSVEIVISGATDIQAAAKLKVVLEANLGLVASLRARLEGAVDVMGTLVGNVDANFLAEIKAACIPVVLTAAEGALSDFEASISASVNVVSSVN